MSDPLVFEVNEKGSIGLQPTQRPAGSAPRPVENRAQQRYDEKRRPQAAVLFRALRDSKESGMSWTECWALGEGNEQWDVGPIVIWLRSRGVLVDARYDAVNGETRFYIG